MCTHTHTHTHTHLKRCGNKLWVKFNATVYPQHPVPFLPDNSLEGEEEGCRQCLDLELQEDKEGFNKLSLRRSGSQGMEVGGCGKRC